VRVTRQPRFAITTHHSCESFLHVLATHLFLLLFVSATHTPLLVIVCVCHTHTFSRYCLCLPRTHTHTHTHTFACCCLCQPRTLTMKQAWIWIHGMPVIRRFARSHLLAHTCSKIDRLLTLARLLTHRSLTLARPVSSSLSSSATVVAVGLATSSLFATGGLTSLSQRLVECAVRCSTQPLLTLQGSVVGGTRRHFQTISWRRVNRGWASRRTMLCG
jgi:hypothetical protein